MPYDTIKNSIKKYNDSETADSSIRELFCIVDSKGLYEHVNC